MRALSYLAVLGLILFLIFGCTGGEPQNHSPSSDAQTPAPQIVSLSAALNGSKPYLCGKNGIYDENALKVMGAKIRGQMAYDNAKNDTIYDTVNRIMYQQIYLISNDTAYSWYKVDFNRMDGFMAKFGVIGQESTGTPRPPQYVIGNMSEYICKEADFDASIFAPAGNIQDYNEELEDSYAQLMDALRQRNVTEQDFMNELNRVYSALKNMSNETLITDESLIDANLSGETR